MIESLSSIAARFAERRLVRILNNAFVRLVPFVIVGAIALAILNLPIPIFQDYIADGLDGRLSDFAQLLTDSTYSVITLAALCSISLSYALEYVDAWNGRPYLFVPMFTSFSCFVILFVWQDGSLNFINIGTDGIFRALIVSLSSLKLLFWLTHLTSRGLADFRGFDANLLVHSAFSAVLPVTITLVMSAGLRIVIDMLFGTTEITQYLLPFIEVSESASYPAVVLTVLTSQLMAFFGAHNFVLFNLLQTINEVSSIPAPFTVQGYYLQFALVGGSGATFGLLVAMVIAGRDWRKSRRMARVALFPMLFNINESLLYGFPVIFNPFYFVPFIIAPLMSASISYVAFSLGIVPPITNMVAWTIPPILSGYISTGSIAASVLQAVCILVSVALYYPFVRAHRFHELQQRHHRFDLMVKALDAAAHDREAIVVNRDDRVGELAREFSAALKVQAKQNKLPFFLVYQPKTDQAGKLVGSEALLRWHDTEMGSISPMAIIELMDESGLAIDLGRWVSATAIREFAEMRESHFTNLRMSINLHPRHLEEDRSFVSFLAELRDHYVVLPGEIEFEITEHMAVNASYAMSETFRQIRDLGFSLTIDDLGMGYSSLNYISDYGVHTVKIDMSLIDKIHDNYKQREIVRSVVLLAGQLNLELVVEGVETIEQVEALTKLGVRAFQGYYFSKPLMIEDFKAYFAEHH